MYEHDASSFNLDPEAALWEHAFAASEITTGLQARVDELLLEIERGRTSSNFIQRDEAARKQAECWQAYQRLQEVKGLENSLLDVLDRYTRGEADEAELRSYLPEPDETETARLSKRRQAIRREQERTGSDSRLMAANLFMAYYDWSSWLTPRTPAPEQRRLTTGRRLARVTMSSGMTPTEAQQHFHFMTADTHGGKSRHSGTPGNRYITASGRRVRKY